MKIITIIIVIVTLIAWAIYEILTRKGKSTQTDSDENHYRGFVIFQDDTGHYLAKLIEETSAYGWLEMGSSSEYTLDVYRFAERFDTIEEVKKGIDWYWSRNTLRKVQL